MPGLDMNRLVGSHDIVLLTLDTLRYDVAVEEWRAGRTPNLASLLPASGWQKRHAPGSFTYASHQAMFAGFLPTPALPGSHARLFAMRFAGSESTDEQTAIFDAPNLVEGLAARDYHTLCVGGTGFFNTQTPLGSVMPSLFDVSHWSPELGVADPNSTENQFRLVASALTALAPQRRAFVFVNVSALHQPNYFYCRGREREDGDDIESHAAALRYVDSQLPILLEALRKRGPCLLLVCSDHGTAYGEEGHKGHRYAHEVVWTVPYGECLLPAASPSETRAPL